MKTRIRLTENDLHRIVKESVKRILKEGDANLASKAAGTAARMAAHPGLSKWFGKKKPSDYAAQAARLRQMAKDRIDADVEKDTKHDEQNGYHEYTPHINGGYTKKQYTPEELKQRTSANKINRKENAQDAYDSARSGKKVTSNEYPQGRLLPKFGRKG